MISRFAGLGLATVVLAAASVSFIGPAQAATAPCSTGSWTLLGESTSDHGVYKGKAWHDRAVGAGGIKVTFSKTKGTYNFTGSHREVVSGVNGGLAYAYWNQYSKGLTINVKFAGNHTGTFTTNGKTASGNATGHEVSTKPTHHDLGYWNVAAIARKGFTDTLIGTKATFTCTTTTLVLTSKNTGHNKIAVWDDLSTLTYQRS